MNLQKLELPVNIPVSIALTSLEGVIVPSNYGPTGQQAKFTTADGRAVYLPLHVGDQVKALGSRNIRLTKKQDGHRRINYEVQPLAGEQGDGTFQILKEKPEQLPPPQASTVSGSSTGSVPNLKHSHEQIVPELQASRKRALWDDGRDLIDAQSALTKYALEKHNGAITPGDVRAIVLTVYIQISRGAQGGRR